MLNHTIYREVSEVTKDTEARGSATELHAPRPDWCLGDAPAQWDVSFGDRIRLSVRRMFWGDPKKSAGRMEAGGNDRRAFSRR